MASNSLVSGARVKTPCPSNSPKHYGFAQSNKETHAMGAELGPRFPLLMAASLILDAAGLCNSQAGDFGPIQFTQSSGNSNYATLYCCGRGNYTFLGDTLHCDTLMLGSCGYGGTFSQTGGDFSVGSIEMVGADQYDHQGSGRFSLNGGTARADS